MFLHLEAGQDKILFYALQQPPSSRAKWFAALRSYLSERMIGERDPVQSEVDAIMDLCTQTEEALR